MTTLRTVFMVASLVMFATLLSGADTISVKAKAKPQHRWKDRATRSVGSLENYQARTIQCNQYGSRLDQQEERTGFFYTLEKDGRWWIIDPHGFRHINRGIVSVSIGTGPAQRKAFDQKFRSESDWAKRTVTLLRDHGFTGTGAWTNDELIQNASDEVSYCINWNFMTTFSKGRTKRGSGHANYPENCILVFDPGWEAFCTKHARQQITRYKEDPNLLGHFFDNELPLKPGMIDRYLRLDEKDPGHLAAISFLKNQHGQDATVDNLTASDRDKFDELVMEKYIGTVARAIKSVDPNHMLLGPRLYSSNASLHVVGKYVDAFCYNLYSQWSPAAKASALAAEVGKPLIVTEYYAKGMDADGLTNQSGAGWCVPTQADRGLFYQNFCLDLMQSKICVGWHWFKYQDNDPTDTSKDPSNLNSNKGILDNHYQPYTPLLDQMKELNNEVYSLIDYFDNQATTSDTGK